MNNIIKSLTQIVLRLYPFFVHKYAIHKKWYFLLSLIYFCDELLAKSSMTCYIWCLFTCLFILLKYITLVSNILRMGIIILALPHILIYKIYTVSFLDVFYLYWLSMIFLQFGCKEKMLLLCQNTCLRSLRMIFEICMFSWYQRV